jgi:hypothetical protein
MTKRQTNSRLGLKAALKTSTAKAKRTPAVVSHEERSQGSSDGRQHGRQVFRQTISLPPEDRALFLSIVDRAQRAGLYSVPLSAVARAALRLLADLTDKALVATLRGIPVVKAGRKPRRS